MVCKHTEQKGNTNVIRNIKNVCILILYINGNYISGRRVTKYFVFITTECEFVILTTPRNREISFKVAGVFFFLDDVRS